MEINVNAENPNLFVTVSKRMVVVIVCVSVVIAVMLFLPTEFTRRLDTIELEQSRTINQKIMAIILRQEAIAKECNYGRHIHTQNNTQIETGPSSKTKVINGVLHPWTFEYADSKNNLNIVN